MKKILTMILALAMCLSMFGCGKPETNETKPASSGDNAVAAGFNKPVNEIGVALILNTNLGDHAICDMSYEGLLQAAEQYGFNYKCVELGGDTTLQVPTMQEYAEDPDFDLIICGTANLKESVQQVAKEYPEQKFILYDAQDELELPNIFSMDHKQNEGAYLAGVAAALLTKTETVGFVGGGENTALDDYLIGYIQGVHSVKENANILISWIGDFKDTAKGKELAVAQAGSGADVVFSVAGGAGLGILAGAAECGIHAIGVDSDQYTTLMESNPEIAKNICTSMVKRCNNTVSKLIGLAIDGTLEWQSYNKWGLAEDAVGLAMDNDGYMTTFTDEQRAYIESVMEKAVSGELNIKSAIGMDNEELQEIIATATK